MRYASGVVFLLSLVVLPSCGRTPETPAADSTPGTSEEAQRAPLELEEDWANALVRRDATTFQRLLAPDFVYTEDSTVISRDDLIKSVVSGPDSVEWARNEGLRLHDFGSAQVITGVLHLRGKGKGGAFDRRFRFTDTWLQRNGRWQIIAAQDYLIPK
jgi:ketosteroid isomerase-like protein